MFFKNDNYSLSKFGKEFTDALKMYSSPGTLRIKSLTEFNEKRLLLFNRYRSLDRYMTFPFFALTIPILKKELEVEDELLEMYIEHAILIAHLEKLNNVETCINSYKTPILKKENGKYKFDVFSDFIVLNVKFYNQDWKNYFGYLENTDVFKDVKFDNLKKIYPYPGDIVYVIDIMKLAKYHKLEPLVVDSFMVYKRINSNISYRRFYEMLCKIITHKDDGVSFLAENANDVDLLCFCISYFKFESNMLISELAIKKYIPIHVIKEYRTLWWLCELWYKNKFKLKVNKEYNDYNWTEKCEFGLNYYLDIYLKKITFKGEPLFCLEPMPSYLRCPGTDYSTNLSEQNAKNTTGNILNKPEIGIDDFSVKHNFPNAIDSNEQENGKSVSDLGGQFDDVDNKGVDYTAVLKNCLYHNKVSNDQLKSFIDDLRELTEGYKGRSFASFIVASIENGIFTKAPSYEVLLKLGFKDFGSRSGYYKAYDDKKKYYRKDIETETFTRWCDSKIKELIIKHNL